jgi:maltooligosyltrehalose trehalohydrolase
MGEEWGAPEPFVYFCDFQATLADQVREGRRREFRRFEKFRNDDVELPDPADRRTFESSRLDWQRIGEEPHARWLQLHRELLAIRRREIVPLIGHITGGIHTLPHDGGFRVDWLLDDGRRLRLLANLSGQPALLGATPGARVIYTTPDTDNVSAASAWSVQWLLQDA